MAKALIWLGIGMAVFFMGLRVMTSALRGTAGPAVEKVLARLTRNQTGAVLTGCVVTAVLQSSSAVTVMVVGLVEAEVLNMSQAVGITLGANLGTTVAPQIFAFPPKLLVVPSLVLMLAVAALVWRKGGETWQGIGVALGGFVLLLTGLQVMADAAAGWGDSPVVYRILTDLEASLPMGLAAGTVVTALLHSSGLVMALVISLARDGLLTLPSAVYLMLGSNIGTCFTTLLAGLGSKKTGRAASLANLIINVAGVAAILPFLNWFIVLIGGTAQALPRQIANAHTVFNLLSAVALFPFIKPLARWLGSGGGIN